MNEQIKEALEMAIAGLIIGHKDAELCERATFACQKALEAIAQTAQEPSNWIEWKGGDNCPLHQDTKVEFELRNGRTIVGYAGDLEWIDYDIIRYRIAKEQL